MATRVRSDIPVRVWCAVLVVAVFAPACARFAGSGADSGDDSSLADTLRGMLVMVPDAPYPGVRVPLPDDLGLEPYDQLVEAATLADLRGAAYPVMPPDASEIAGLVEAAGETYAGVPDEVIVFFALEASPAGSRGQIPVPASVRSKLEAMGPDADIGELYHLAGIAASADQLAIDPAAAEAAIDAFDEASCTRARELAANDTALLDLATERHLRRRLGLTCSLTLDDLGAEFASFVRRLAARPAGASWPALWALTMLGEDGLVDDTAVRAELEALAAEPDLPVALGRAAALEVRHLVAAFIAANVPLPAAVPDVVQSRYHGHDEAVLVDAALFFETVEALALLDGDEVRSELRADVNLDAVDPAERLAVSLAVADREAESLELSVRSGTPPFLLAGLVWIAHERGVDACPVAEPLLTPDVVESLEAVTAEGPAGNVFLLPAAAALVALADLCGRPIPGGLAPGVEAAATATLGLLADLAVDPDTVQAAAAAFRSLCILADRGMAEPPRPDRRWLVDAGTLPTDPSAIRAALVIRELRSKGC